MPPHIPEASVVGEPIKTLLRPVLHVVLCGTDKQVIWAHAPFVVAVVADEQSGLNTADCQLISNPVCRLPPAIAMNSAIAIREEVACPPPATV
jgi:hypothetical protein